jgi:hypothetical protein
MIFAKGGILSSRSKKPFYQRQPTVRTCENAGNPLAPQSGKYTLNNHTSEWAAQKRSPHCELIAFHRTTFFPQLTVNSAGI